LHGAHRAWYRVRQFARVCGASFSQVDEAYVAERLTSPALLRLFYSMPRVEQHHGIDVCRTLERREYTDPDLHVAALLHDAGKAVAPPHLWERVLVVLTEHFAPHRAEAWGAYTGDNAPADNGVPQGLHRAFAVRRHHAVWGAQMATGAGASPRAVALIEHHHDRQPAGLSPQGNLNLEWLAALQAADET
jgi:hypothetical protein